ncbi:MAG TPA: FadR/GntR family transcriptional regulator [Candidatus Acidoferrales bacterium]|nr:FadR/GntR family transcriptional regulator [Candidatus Acidoferrales bacterium]
MNQVSIQQVRRTKVYQEIVAQIQALVAEGRILPGERLPPERELAELFRASRNSVRDALRVLEQMGLIESRHGDGTYVGTLRPEELTEPLASLLLASHQQMRELFEVRRIFEPEVAAYAAERASPEDLDELEQILRKQRQEVESGGTGLEEDTAFHYGIASAARNPVLLRMIDTVMDLLREVRQRSLQQGGRPLRSLAGHRAILEALRSGDATAARSSMLRHLREVEERAFAKDEG